jgi:class 3 adenylate cyclase
MTSSGTIVKVDINGFAKETKNKSPNETAEYLGSFYQYIAKNVHRNGWNFVKAMGDCILISIPQKVSSESVEKFYSDIKDKYNVSIQYRMCTFAIKQIEIGNYKCTDIFGDDINNLFLADKETFNIG